MSIRWTDQEALEETFLGRAITGFNEAKHTLELDNGQVVRVRPNPQAGCCGGFYELRSLATCENIITAVNVVVEEHNKPEKNLKGKRGKKPRKTRYEEGKTYRLFVFAGHSKINAIVVEGDDGSGRYGTGFELEVY